MPIYGYACKNCSHTLDALQKMNDDVLVDCPECGEPSLKRQLSAPRFRLKGKGWYETDFKKDNQRNLSNSDSETSSKDKSGAEKGSDKGQKKGQEKGADKAAATKTKSDSGPSSSSTKSTGSKSASQ